MKLQSRHEERQIKDFTVDNKSDILSMGEEATQDLQKISSNFQLQWNNT